ncbi:hypothetical protein KC959_03585 [Candidatus Saccharibacteria bacterium]|nr:hypothetical protein [Candidatus Saccharibacteria bacterium]
MNHLGLLSIFVSWVGQFILLKKWPGDGTMTFSQHVARKRESIIFYMVLWSFVLPAFYWFMMIPFADKLGLGILFKSFATLASIGMLGAALIPETTELKTKIHRVSAYGMAYLLCPLVFIVLIQGSISGFARVFLWVTGLWMLAGVIRSSIEKRQHGKKTLLFQAFYVMLFHVSILVAYYL